MKDGKHVAESAICHPSEGEVGQGSVTRREQWLSGLRSHLLFLLAPQGSWDCKNLVLLVSPKKEIRKLTLFLS